MKKKPNRLQKDILFIFISSFIVVVAWIGFNLYHIYVTSTINGDLQLQLTPISPVFDPQTIQQLKTRENINPEFQIQKVAATPTPPLPISTFAPTPIISSGPAVTAQSSSEASGTAQTVTTNSSINKTGQ